MKPLFSADTHIDMVNKRLYLWALGCVGMSFGSWSGNACFLNDKEAKTSYEKFHSLVNFLLFIRFFFSFSLLSNS